MAKLSFSILAVLGVWLFAVPGAWTQESRGSITGKVTDPQGAVIPGAPVLVINTETNVSSRTSSNQTGYFEVTLLNPGSYSISVEAPGFKKAVRSGVQLSVGDRLDIGIQLEVGQITETVNVTAAAPLLETTNASSGRVIDRRQITELPVRDLNPFTLTALASGMQWTGVPVNTKPFDNAGVSAFNTMGGVGQSEYMIDGAPVTGTNRRVGFVPPSEAVEEFKLETTPFDASYGHTSGAVVNVMTKPGTNTFHGSLYDQHQQERWNATPHFTRLSFEDQVRQGKKKADDPKQPPGRSNIFGATLGGPVRVPKIYNGKDKFFFFFSYNGIYTRRAQNPEASNMTVPKMAWRQGDFSDLLAVDATKFTIYDPRTARRDGSRVVRTPFPGNKGVPVLNPSYKFYEETYPKPNDVPGIVSPEGINNFYVPEAGSEERFNSLLNRYDYNISDRHRLFGRWYWNHRLSRSSDWTYATRPGLHLAGTTRINKGVGADYVWTISSAQILNIGANWTQFGDGAQRPNQTSYKPSDVGLPGYLDTKAGPYHTLPEVSFTNIQKVGDTYPTVGSVGTTGELKASITNIRGDHSLKYGWVERRYWFTSAGPAYSSGRFSFSNSYMRAADNTTTASGHGLDWAAFMMGLPSGVTLDTNDSGYFSTRYRALYLQDDWRISGKLRISIGLRYEREGGITERFNRGLSGGFLSNAKLPFTDGAQAAYAANPLSELAAARFVVLGGTEYLGTNTKNFNDGTHHILPRFGAVYQLNDKTVLRGGYGWYYDTFNVSNTRPSQFGYSQPTSTVLSMDNALTFCCGVGAAEGLSAARNPMTDPFPVRADGTRFDAPYGNGLGVVAQAGRGYTFIPRSFNPSRQQRWRAGVQRQIRSDMVVEVSYNGSVARTWTAQRLDYLPQQYWATGNVRNQAVDDNLNQNVPNPFNIANLSALQASNPLIYNYLRGQGFFTGTTIRKHQLLRAFPQMNGVYGLRPEVEFGDSEGRGRYHDLQLQFEKRFSRGFHSAVVYTCAYGRRQDLMYNEFDTAPSWQTNNDVRPHRLVWTAIYEVPFGKGRKWLHSSPLRHVAGGWQVSWIYQYQNGPATSWSNRFFYGDVSRIAELFKQNDTHSKDIHVWFDPNIVYTSSGAVPSGFQGFDGRAATQPGSFQVRMFPSLLDAIRADGLRFWDVKAQKRFTITERVRSALSVDLLNATNHTNFGAPNTNPTDKNFGRVTSQNGLSRVIQLNLRLDF